MGFFFTFLIKVFYNKVRKRFPYLFTLSKVDHLKNKKTVYTIAQELNLSPSTISKVLNKTGSVSEQTRERVLAYVKEVGFVPTSSARILKSKKTYSIGVVFSDQIEVGLENSFYSSILQFFKAYVEKEGYELSFITTKLGRNKLTYYEWCRNKRIDGVYIVVGDESDKELIELIESGIPCVSTDMVYNQLSTITSDHQQGIYLAMDYAIHTLKVEKIATIVGPLSSISFSERLKAYQSYVKMHDLYQEKAYITYAPGFGQHSGEKAILNMMKQVIQKPELIIVGSDDLALGVLNGLSELKMKVPEDIQLIGFDDVTFARHFTPPLTTIRQDRKALGEHAAKQLITLMEQDQYNNKQTIKLPVTLIERQTTKK